MIPRPYSPCQRAEVRIRPLRSQTKRGRHQRRCWWARTFFPIWRTEVEVLAVFVIELDVSSRSRQSGYRVQREVYGPFGLGRIATHVQPAFFDVQVKAVEC